MGRALARQFAARGETLILLGRDISDLKLAANDLELRGAAKPVGVAYCDLALPDTFSPALDAAESHSGAATTVVMTAGMFAPQSDLEADSAAVAELLTLNFTNTILFCEEARRRLLARGGGTVCVFSSVAGDRGRSSVVIYGAAKAGLSRYLEGLDHRYRRHGLNTVCIKPGFVHTEMTAGLKAPPFASDADTVARRAIRAIDRGSPEVYAPRIWRLVMWIVRILPRFVMRRVSF
jgi:short-subunit dehydrogenase